MSRLVLSVDPGNATGAFVLADHAARTVHLAAWWSKRRRSAGAVLIMGWMALEPRPVRPLLAAQEPLISRPGHTGRPTLLRLLSEVLAAVSATGCPHALAIEGVVSIGGHRRGGKVSAAQLVELAEARGFLDGALRCLSRVEGETHAPTAAEWRHTLGIPGGADAKSCDRLARQLLERRGWDLSGITSGHAVDALGVGVWADARLRATPRAQEGT